MDVQFAQDLHDVLGLLRGLSRSDVADVMQVLGELDIHPGQGRRIIEVWNKIDLLEPAQRENVRSKAAAADPPAVPLSAVTGEGVSDLLDAVERALMSDRPTVTVDLGVAQLAAAPWLYEHTEVLERADNPETGGAQLKVRIAEPRMAAFQDWAQREQVSVAASGSRADRPV
jgi:GTP-binding protein HflX